MRCPCCREGIEDRMHVLSTCGGPGRVGIRKQMVARLETILREAWPVMGDWENVKVGGSCIRGVGQPRVELLMPTLLDRGGGCRFSGM